MLRSKLNNSVSATIRKALNKIIFEFKTNDLIIMMGNSTGLDIENERKVVRQKAEDIIAFRNVYIKTTYDCTHILLQFKAEDRVFLRLH